MANIVAFLPLRSGSKRVKNKNIRIVGYYPLFYHAIKKCLSSQYIGDIFVSTDSLYYRNLIKKFFPEERVKVIIRSQKYSSDNSKTEDSIKEFLDQFENNSSYNGLLLVQATSPLFDVNDLNKAIEKFNTQKFNSVFSASESKNFYIEDMDQLIERPMTQVKPKKIYEVGCFWIFNIEKFKTTNNRIIEPYDYVIVSEYSALDIDTEQDIFIADCILSKEIREKESRYFKKRKIVEAKINKDKYFDLHTDPDGKYRNILFEEESRQEFAKNEIERINSMIQNYPESYRPKLLSVGLGGGYAEKLISNRYYKVGIEPDLIASKIASDYVDEIHNISIEDAMMPENGFDVVFAHHVIEHIADPVQFIKKINSLLRSGGKLVLGTPNFDSGAARRYGEKFRLLNDYTHISLFSEVGLREFLQDFGFQIDYVDFPFFETNYFNKEDLLRLLDKDSVSPPFYGSIMTFYATKK